MDDRLAGEAAKLATQAQELANNLKGVAQQITDISAQGTLAIPDAADASRRHGRHVNPGARRAGTGGPGSGLREH